MRNYRFLFLLLVNEHCISAVHYEGDKVNPPENEVSNTGEKADNAGKKSCHVLGFGKSDQTVDTADKEAEQELKYNSVKPRNVIKLVAERSVCHSFSSFQVLLQLF